MAEMSPIAWALRPLKRYAQFSGRAPRAEFWWFMLFMIVLWVAISFVFGASLVGLGAGGADSSSALGALGVAGILMGILWLALIIPTIALQVRRMHDINRSGWWIGGFYILYLGYMVLTLGLSTEGSVPGMGVLGAVAISALVFLVYAIVLLVFYFMRGTRGPNRFGPDPYGTDNLDEVFA